MNPDWLTRSPFRRAAEVWRKKFARAVEFWVSDFGGLRFIIRSWTGGRLFFGTLILVEMILTSISMTLARLKISF